MIDNLIVREPQYSSPYSSEALWKQLGHLGFRMTHPLEVAYFLDLLDTGDEEIEYIRLSRGKNVSVDNGIMQTLLYGNGLALR